MPAYVLAVGEITDPTDIAAYRAAAPKTVVQYGGSWAVRGSVVEVLEGDVKPTEAVVLEFETEEAARRWYDSEEYRAAKELRSDGSRDLLVVLLTSTAPPVVAPA